MRKSSEQIDEQSLYSSTQSNKQRDDSLVYDAGEEYVDRFRCSYKNGILLTGKIYVTTKRVYFKSKFNKKNLFFGDTHVHIWYKQMKGISKGKMFLIDNTIIFVDDSYRKYKFTSFFQRNKAYKVITGQMEKLGNKFMGDVNQVLTNQLSPFTRHSGDDDMEKEEQEVKRERAVTEVDMDERGKAMIEETFLTDCQSQEIDINVPISLANYIQVIYSNRAFTVQDIEYPSFWDYNKTILKAFEKTITDWTPPLQHNVGMTFQRNCTYRVPPKNFLLSNKSSIEEHQKLLIQSNSLIFDATVVTKNVPYCDNFSILNRQIITKSQKGIHIQFLQRINWKKKFVLQSLVRKAIKKETANLMDKQLIKPLREILAQEYPLLSQDPQDDQETKGSLSQDIQSRNEMSKLQQSVKDYVKTQEDHDEKISLLEKKNRLLHRVNCGTIVLVLLILLNQFWFK